MFIAASLAWTYTNLVTEQKTEGRENQKTEVRSNQERRGSDEIS